MADKTTELERVYTIPLRKTKDLTRGRRADNAVRDVRRFLQRHMKSENIWLDTSVNEVLWSKGKFTIPSRIRVRATRFSDGVVEVTLPEAATAGSVRSQLAERREKAAEKQILKPAVPTDEEEGETAGPGADRPVTEVTGVGPATAEKLEKAGITSLAALAAATAADIAKATGHQEDKVQPWIDEAKKLVAAEPAPEAAPAEAAPAEKAEEKAKGGEE